MANWYAKDALWSDPLANRHAGNKARKDIEVILDSLGWNALEITGSDKHLSANIIGKAGEHLGVAETWDRAFRRIASGDVVLLQLPLVNHTVLFAAAMKRACACGVRFIGLIHDLDTMREMAGRGSRTGFLAKMRIKGEEAKPLALCSAVIAHNEAMREILASSGLICKERIVCLEIFDYLCDCKPSTARVSRNAPIAICGSLRPEKAGYAYGLPRGAAFNLYGVGYEGGSSENVTYKGSFAPEELVCSVEGSFGLVWDGPSIETCEGAYGSYLKVNNPHKASMYLAAGMPVIVWRGAALAGLIGRETAGICVECIGDIRDLAASLTDADYEALRSGALAMSSRLRNGYYTSRAVGQALKIVAGR